MKTGDEYQFVFGEHKDGEWVLTDKRPTPDVMRHLLKEIRPKVRQAKLHTPGEGYHWVPGPVEVGWNGRNWYAYVPDSLGAILASLEAVCHLFGKDFRALCQASENEADHTIEIDPRDRALLSRPITRDDLTDILDDLGDLNHSSLRDAVMDTFEIPTELLWTREGLTPPWR